MDEAPTLLFAWASGGLLGAVFFGGLWFTVARIASSPRPALLLFASALLRTGAALAGFYFVAGGEWPRLLLCLLGFVMARGIVMRQTRSMQAPPTSSRHAPQP